MPPRAWTYRCPMCGIGMSPPLPKTAHRKAEPKTHCRQCWRYARGDFRQHYLQNDRPLGDPGRGSEYGYGNMHW